MSGSTGSPVSASGLYPLAHATSVEIKQTIMSIIAYFFKCKTSYVLYSLSGLRHSPNVLWHKGYRNLTKSKSPAETGDLPGEEGIYQLLIDELTQRRNFFCQIILGDAKGLSDFLTVD